jgi:hypothetical protein
MATDASHLLGSPQLAGVRVNPWGAFRRAEASTTAFSGGIPVSGKLGVAIGDALGGDAAAQERKRAAELAASTPGFGNLGYLALTAHELALITTKVTGAAKMTLVEAVGRVPLSEVTSAQLGGGWPHLSYFIFSPAPLTITLRDGAAWEMEISRVFRKRGRRFVRVLTGRIASVSAGS